MKDKTKSHLVYYRKKAMTSLFLLLLQLLSVLWLAAGSSFTKPNCMDQCGGVQIPYPFGVGANCYHDTSFEIICNTSFHPPKPFLHQFNLEVLDINWPGRYSLLDPRANSDSADDQRLTVALPPQNLCEIDVAHSYDFRGSPYRFSRWYNVLMMEGCGNSVALMNSRGEVLTGCASVCASGAANMNITDCYGVGCCQASLLSSPTDDTLQQVEGLDFYDIVLSSLPNSNSCNASSALVQSDSVQTFVGNLSTLRTFPTVLEWQATFVSSQVFYDNFSCTYTDSSHSALLCKCGYRYEGNVYLPDGCQVVDGCHKCSRSRCLIAYGSTDSGSHYYCEENKLVKLASILGLSIGVGLLLFVLGCYWLYRFVKQRKEIKRKATYFKRNGGLLLQQQMSSNDGIVEKTKLFAVVELEKATDEFNENRILGQGGQGTVYKGMLMDGRTVAIKKSKRVDESQVEQFINEVVILSQINHRNVVKLLGCCLETEVPILVYEYIPNGTLYQHISGSSEEFHVNWKMRLQIAAESAGAVAYLHSSSSAPIYHRDIKSTNILLDDKYRAKVSDFGTSRAINIEQTHVTTCVLGTYGYLDPEYFQSNQFNEKSDVYSFGVVLVELITGKKPICPTGSGGWISLATEFLCQMEDSRLFDILDTRIAEEGNKEEFMAVAELARRCLNMNGKQRPTMKEVAVILDAIRSPYLPNLKEVKPTMRNHLVTKVIDMHSGPCSRSTFSSEDDPPAYTTEIQPLMYNI